MERRAENITGRPPKTTSQKSAPTLPAKHAKSESYEKKYPLFDAVKVQSSWWYVPVNCSFAGLFPSWDCNVFLSGIQNVSELDTKARRGCEKVYHRNLLDEIPFYVKIYLGILLDFMWLYFSDGPDDLLLHVV